MVRPYAYCRNLCCTKCNLAIGCPYLLKPFHSFPSQRHTETSYQLPLHVFIARRANEDGVLHEADEAPEGVTFILDLSKQGGHQVRHALTVAHVWIKHGVVEQNPPGMRTEWRTERAS